MSLSALLNRPCAILRRTSSGERDRFGNPLHDELLVATVCELQQRQRAEPGHDSELSDTSWALFLPPGTDLNTGDVVLVDDARYELVGDPWEARNPRTQAMSHVEATVRLTAAADDSPRGPGADGDELVLT